MTQSEPASDPVIRDATIDDIPRLLSLAERFVKESELPFTFDIDVSNAHFTYVIEDKEYIFIVEEDDGVITGGIMGALDQDFCKETSAYITKMYVEKELRGFGTSRDLVEAFQARAEMLGASAIFASATAGMGERVEQLYVKLFQRYGYKVLGRVLVKEL